VPLQMIVWTSRRLIMMRKKSMPVLNVGRGNSGCCPCNFVCVCVCMCVYMYMCVWCVCVYVCVYVCVCCPCNFACMAFMPWEVHKRLRRAQYSAAGSDKSLLVPLSWFLQFSVKVILKAHTHTHAHTHTQTHTHTSYLQGTASNFAEQANYCWQKNMWSILLPPPKLRLGTTQIKEISEQKKSPLWARGDLNSHHLNSKNQGTKVFHILLISYLIKENGCSMQFFVFFETANEGRREMHCRHSIPCFPPLHILMWCKQRKDRERWAEKSKGSNVDTSNSLSL